MKSPIDGVVVARLKVPGEFVEDQAILKIAQLDPLYVELIAPVELYGTITPGMQIEVVPEISGFGRQVATITMVDRVIDAASGTFDIRAELKNPNNTIPSGLRCISKFIVEKADIETIAAEEPIDENSMKSNLSDDSDETFRTVAHSSNNSHRSNATIILDELR